MMKSEPSISDMLLQLGYACKYSPIEMCVKTGIKQISLIEWFVKKFKIANYGNKYLHYHVNNHFLYKMG